MKEKIALVIGNGPSAEEINKELLDGVRSYGCNHVNQLFDKWGRQTDAVVITDSNRIKEIGGSYSSFKGDLYIGDERYPYPPIKKIRSIVGRDFFPLRQQTKKNYPKGEIFQNIRFHRFLYTTIFDKWKMSFDHNIGLNFGRSVVVSAIQIAAIEGYKKILLSGVDSSYRNTHDYAGSIDGSIGYVNQTFISNPRLHMEPFLVILQLYFEKMGVELIDCSKGGALRYIKKSSLSDEIHD